LKKEKARNILAGFIASAGIWLFAGFIHTAPVIAIAGMIVTSFSVAYFAKSLIELLRIAGLTEYKWKLFPYSLAGLVLGISVGTFYGLNQSKALFPLYLTVNAIIAPSVGIAEELLFRGFIQGSMSRVSGWLGIFFASFSHTGYKVLVICMFPSDLGINLFYLAIFTFTGGLLLGWLRKASESIIPSALAHGCFDIMIYGALASLPVWVWG
jgi:membrane protease YdiL (CAAX protease family)